ncbi:DUF5347 domain-containing protein [Morganella morganii]|uniref:DUF5347 domain-containing protein n=1 Tax=Morganella morganii TaxID=582 RepID=UPI0034E4043E
MQHAYDIGEPRAFAIPVSQRTDGLNHIAKLRSEHFGVENKELEKFFKEMRDRFDPMYQDNKKFLGVILYMANIEKEKHDCDYNDFSSNEIFDIVKAINHIRAISAILPKHLVLPQ